MTFTTTEEESSFTIHTNSHTHRGRFGARISSCILGLMADFISRTPLLRDILHLSALPAMSIKVLNARDVSLQ